MRETKIIIEKNEDQVLVASFWKPEDLQPDTYSWIADLTSKPCESRVDFQKRCYATFLDLAPCYNLESFQILHSVGQFRTLQNS